MELLVLGALAIGLWLGTIATGRGVPRAALIIPYCGSMGLLLLTWLLLLLTPYGGEWFVTRPGLRMIANGAIYICAAGAAIGAGLLGASYVKNGFVGSVLVGVAASVVSYGFAIIVMLDAGCRLFGSCL